MEATAVEPGVGSSLPAFVEAVRKALAAREFILLDDAGHARFIADVKLTRVEAATGVTKVPVAGRSAVAGGASSMVGGGVNFSLPTRKTKSASLLQTRLEIRIRKRGEQDEMWHGAAMTVRAADTVDGADGALARDLAEAIFRDYPAQSESIASVP